MAAELPPAASVAASPLVSSPPSPPPSPLPRPSPLSPLLFLCSLAPLSPPAVSFSLSYWTLALSPTLALSRPLSRARFTAPFRSLSREKETQWHVQVACCVMCCPDIANTGRD
eukprot:563807-Rhodomonas_salina.1